jgi:hypothetical protein
MATYESPIKFEGGSELEFEGFTIAPMIGHGSFTVQGIRVLEHEQGYHRVAKFVGEPNIPNDIAHTRRYVYELMRRMGTPVLMKKMINPDDVEAGVAEKSPNFSETYEQTRNRDPISHGVGYVSVEKHPEEWIDLKTSKIIVSETQPPDTIAAPKYRGYGPGMLIWVIEPDTAVDFFKQTPEGAFIKVQTANAITGWWPDINDNDLLIHVEMNKRGFITGTAERYQAKQSSPHSIRGSNERTRPGRHEYTGDLGTRYVVNTSFEMILLPSNNELQRVEADR